LQALTIRQKNIMNGILTGVVLIIMVTGGLFYRNYRQRQLLQQQTIRELQTERQLLATDAVLQGQEDERSRLARDLHDGLGGILSGAKFTFDAMKDNMIMTAENQKAFSRGMDLLETSIRELRRVAHNMMPESLVRTGLPQAVRDLCADYQQHHVNIIYQEYGLDDVQFKQSVSITVYRIIQELLNNALRHAQASAIIVQLSYHNNLLQLTVEDNGKGFSKQQTSPSRGMGWANIRSRVEYLNGTIDMNSSEGKGTSVTITLPL
jgi:signal transduction histidine kinase